MTTLRRINRADRAFKRPPLRMYDDKPECIGKRIPDRQKEDWRDALESFAVLLIFVGVFLAALVWG